MKLKLSSVSSATNKGRRPYQEDRFFSTSLSSGLLLGVFDGHGGADCAERANNSFAHFFDYEIGVDSRPANALLEAFASVNEETAYMEDGTSASIAFIPWSADRVWIAVLGDSPVIVKTADGAIWHAPEHNVRTNKAERLAAEKRGGTVSGGYLFSSWNGPGLQMARAFGDAHLNRVLDRTPEVFLPALGAGSFVLVASDGALDPGHADADKAAKAVVDLIESGGDAQAIVNRAIAIPTGDNVSALLVKVETE